MEPDQSTPIQMKKTYKAIEKKSIAIVGGGITGLSAARILDSHGYKVKVYEATANIGGLVSCSVENGSLFHRVGGHVFNSKDARVNEWFWRNFDREKEFTLSPRNAAIYLMREIVPYPIELNLACLNPEISLKIINELINLSNDESKSINSALDYPSLEAFMLNNFGKTLCDIYFVEYNKKIWNRNLDEIPMKWLDGKLPMIKPREIIENNIIRKADGMVHSTFHYPIHGGSQFIIDRLAEGLHIINEKVWRINHERGQYNINERLNECFDHIVYTGDLRALKDILKQSILSDILLQSPLDMLKSNSTTTMLCECDKNPYSWVYIPGRETKIHRMIMTGNFAASNNSVSTSPNRITCTVEHSGHLTRKQMESELKQLPFSPEPIAYNFCENSYIIHDHHTRPYLEKLLPFLSNQGFFCCGRFGQWQYLNMDAAIASAMNVCDMIMQ